MNSDNLSVYLNDHLAGSMAGLEILESLCGLLENSEFAAEIEALRAEVEQDREELEQLIERLGYKQSAVRKASGWLAEKAMTLKLLVDDPRSGPLRIYESLEALSLGVEGKRCLWEAMIAVAGDDPRINLTQIRDLHDRARDQRHRVERMRLSTAQSAFRQETADES